MNYTYPLIAFLSSILFDDVFHSVSYQTWRKEILCIPFSFHIIREARSGPFSSNSVKDVDNFDLCHSSLFVRAAFFTSPASFVMNLLGFARECVPENFVAGVPETVTTALWKCVTRIVGRGSLTSIGGCSHLEQMTAMLMQCVSSRWVPTYLSSTYCVVVYSSLESTARSEPHPSTLRVCQIPGYPPDFLFIGLWVPLGHGGYMWRPPTCPWEWWLTRDPGHSPGI